MLQGGVRSIPHTVVAEGHQFESTMAYGSNDVYFVIKANYFGKKFLRMAGIVQMLHAFKQPSDNYLYDANRT